MNGYYEHHLKIKQNKMCPFKVAEAHSGFNYSVPCNWHNNIEILLVKDGSGAIQYGKHTLPLEKDDIIIVNSGELHRPYSRAGVSYCFIIIDEGFCKENGIDTAVLHFTERFRDAETERLIINAAERMKEYSALQEPLTVARLRAAMLSLIIDVASRHSVPLDVKKEVSSPSEEYVKRAIGYINERYSQCITLDELASLCGITKFHLAREFKRITGQTVFTYTNFIRCKQAEMLLSEGKTVTEAAYESGFESLSYFSRTYKKLMGEAPSKRGRN